ncbi:MAG TPA: FliM/FliN family flagellar motor switch protein [Verrucomicrobiae bacterium]|nr:FliM/FliN family flagellar motor switch protein [Verrucomicrobiae bacterium]
MAGNEKTATKTASPPLLPPEPGGDWGELRFVTVTASVDVPVVGLTVRELFRLEKGSLVVSVQQSGANAPVKIGETILGWGEFYVVDDALALRVVELA